VAGKRIGDVLNRIHVAQPKPRPGAAAAARPPVIPPGVSEARAKRAAGERKKTERDLQEEHGGAGAGRALAGTCMLRQLRGRPAAVCVHPKRAALDHPACACRGPLSAGVYSADLRKHYDLADAEWKYDVMPEIMDGHNVLVSGRSGAWAARGPHA
jgi:nucleolar GTP-binding protein